MKKRGAIARADKPAIGGPAKETEEVQEETVTAARNEAQALDTEHLLIRW
jgi:hypothetical protein